MVTPPATTRGCPAKSMRIPSAVGILVLEVETGAMALGAEYPMLVLFTMNEKHTLE